MQETILVSGSNGQIGTELLPALREKYSDAQVIGMDIRKGHENDVSSFIQCDITNLAHLSEAFDTYKPTTVYHLAALLSARGEKDPLMAWELNMTGLLNILRLCVRHGVKKVFWPSSIAVFGKSSPKLLTPQEAFMDPSTVYGISKLAGERWCEYYHRHEGLDVRSLRYPGIISWKTAPGGGTTDYAIEMYREAFRKGAYTSYISAGTALPMIDMKDAIRATLELMEADAHSITVRGAYNLNGISFSPQDLAMSIRKHMLDFKADYVEGDLRQQIADSWPQSIDDSYARRDWGWNSECSLDEMTSEMLAHASSIP